MPVIHELSDHLADLIAAGEVVERPSSVAKELIENAIDAGATRITVELENGGISYLRIADNGCGMSAEDAPVAFRRHATSKLRTEADLAAIGTLGFRGEALAAISSVSHVDLFTKQTGQLAGVHLHLDAGTVTCQEEVGCPEGTTFIVRDLFYNTPARMKFLKKDFTEAGYVVSVAQNAALSHPEIAFTVIKDGKQVFSTPGDGKLIAPIFSVFGRENTENMMEAARFTRDNMEAWGYITKPHAGRANRSMQHFFVNGRYVKSRLMQAAFEEAYRNRIITGKYPSGVIYLTLPLHLVDVNVHPAKTEVKFAQEKQVFEMVYITCRNAIESHDNVPQMKAEAVRRPKEDRLTEEQVVLQSSGSVKTESAAAPVVSGDRQKASVQSPLRKLPDTLREPEKKSFVREQTAAVKPSPREIVERFAEPERPRGVLRQRMVPLIECDQDDRPLDLEHMPRAQMPPPDPELAREQLARWRSRMEKREPQAQPSAQATPQKQEDTEPFAQSARVIGEVFRTYLLAEDKDGLILIDKHAAHERLIFNQLREQTKMSQQQLLTPVVVTMEPAEYAAIAEELETVQNAGFDISPFGKNSFAVRAIPAYLDSADVSAVVSEMAEKLLSRRAPTPDRLDDLLHTVACKAAIKAGKETTVTELQQLCDRVLHDPDVTCCPHGRPVTVRLSKYEIDKMFKRVNQ